MTKAISRRSVLIVGFGDIGARVARLLCDQSEVTALIRPSSLVQKQEVVAHTGVRVWAGDLGQPHSLAVHVNDATAFDTVFHFAPPPTDGADASTDPHTDNLLAMLNALSTPPRRIVYISTTGVYGDAGGAWVDEDTPVKPKHPRGFRRVYAENALQYWSLQNSVTCVRLRAPGIYAQDRLPLARLEAGLPAVCAAEDGFSNHIHADDLAAASVAAMLLTKSDVLNIVDDSALKMGDYFDLVADYSGIPRPPRLPRTEALAAVSPMMRSFMQESRRIRNERMKEVLGGVGFKLRYPTVLDALQPGRASAD
jgi:nucleoside-diphosphate-sugar epimerase